MFRYDLYWKTCDCAWNGRVKWVYSSSLMRVKVLETRSQYKVKQTVKKKTTKQNNNMKPNNNSRKYDSSVPGKVCTGSLTGENHSTYTVILRAGGNEATAWWEGRCARVAAVYVVFIPSCAPGGEIHGRLLLGYCLPAICWSIYMFLCLIGFWWKQLQTFYVYTYFQYNVSVHPKILEGLLLITRNKSFEP